MLSFSVDKDLMKMARPFSLSAQNVIAVALEFRTP